MVKCVLSIERLVSPRGAAQYSCIVTQLSRNHFESVNERGHDGLFRRRSDRLDIQLGHRFDQAAAQHDDVRAKQMHDRRDRRS